MVNRELLGKVLDVGQGPDVSTRQLLGGQLW
jgi:hypothetical protein